jgi:hypothetical protein
VAAALETDPALHEAVARWETRLAPLAVLATPEAPPPHVWSRIEASMPGVAPPGVARAAAVVPAAPARLGWLWRGWAIGASALAAGLAGFLVLRPAEPPRLMTVLLTQQDQPAWMVEAAGNAIRLAASTPGRCRRGGCCNSGPCRRGRRHRLRWGCPGQWPLLRHPLRPRAAGGDVGGDQPGATGRLALGTAERARAVHRPADGGGAELERDHLRRDHQKARSTRTNDSLSVTTASISGNHALKATAEPARAGGILNSQKEEGGSGEFLPPTFPAFFLKNLSPACVQSARCPVTPVEWCHRGAAMTGAASCAPR